jgi:hypothetical protein
MCDLGIKTWIEAARSYARLRRRYWRSFLGAMLLLIMGMPLSTYRHELNPIVYGLIVFLLVIAFLACWVRSVITLFALWGFRCPRCGRRFIMAWWSSWPSKRCKHCELDLGLAAVATAKTSVAVDLWESST